MLPHSRAVRDLPNIEANLEPLTSHQLYGLSTINCVICWQDQDTNRIVYNTEQFGSHREQGSKREKERGIIVALKIHMHV
jgi:hypothetical protein